MRPGLLALSMMAAPAFAACPPEGRPLPCLQGLSAQQWKLDDDAERQRLALELLAWSMRRWRG